MKIEASLAPETGRLKGGQPWPDMDVTILPSAATQDGSMSWGFATVGFGDQEQSTSLPTIGCETLLPTRGEEPPESRVFMIQGYLLSLV